MRPVNKELRKTILSAAKVEFLANGFQKASLRRIAAAAGVTTGAVYCYYKDKSAIFNALVAGPANTLLERYNSESEQVCVKPAEEQLAMLQDTTAEVGSWMIDHIYAHYDAFLLIARCAAGTDYEDYVERLIEIETESSFQLVSQLQQSGKLPATIDRQLVHILSGMLFTAMFEEISHDIPKKTACQHMATLQRFYSVGWFDLLGISQ